MRLDFRVAIQDHLAVVAVKLQRLSKRDKVLPTIVAHQGLGDDLLSGLDSFVPEAGRLMRVSSASLNVVDDGQTAHSGNVA